MRKSFASFSFGCRVNLAEIEVLHQTLILQGFSLSNNSPNFYIINSCAVTQKAEREIRQFIYQTRKKYPKTKIIVIGCGATKWVNDKTQLKEVDWFVVNQDKENLAKLLVKRYCSSTFDKLSVNLSRTLQQTNDELLDSARRIQDKYLSSGRLFVKIQDGCQRFCSYCIVPYLRGKPKSNRITEIIKYIKPYEGKIQEVILTAINTEAFGLDTGESFIDLLDQVIKKTRIPRISLGSLHPWSLGQNFFRFYEKILPLNRLVNFFHIPLQSGSNKILRLMNRGYTKEEFVEKLNILKSINPLALIGTDIIVGFLDENNHDFEETYNFLKDSPISKFHIFRFSQRENTPAFRMAKYFTEPTSSEKLKRARALAKLGKQKYSQFLEKHISLTFPALCLEKRVDTFQEALLNNQVPVFITTAKDLKGKIFSVKLEKIQKDRLFGRLV